MILPLVALALSAAPLAPHEGGAQSDDAAAAPVVAAASPPAAAARTAALRGRPRPRRGRRAPARRRPAGPVTVPIDVGVGPVVMFPNPPALQDQAVFTGLELSLAAVIDKALINAHRDQIPAGLRGAARGLSEVRYRPWFVALVPERLIISPQVLDLGARTGMYGAVWRPLGLGVTLLDTRAANISLNGAVDVAYIFIHSASLGGGSLSQNSITHFLRPGINAALILEVPVTRSFVISAGWSSDLFIPQPFGRPPWEITPVEDSLWHLGGPFLQLHIRIPYEVNL